AGVPVLARVDAILRPTCPDLPTPLTTTRPWQASIRPTASRKRSSRRAASALTASASIASTLRARSSAGVDVAFFDESFMDLTIALVRALSPLYDLAVQV